MAGGSTERTTNIMCATACKNVLHTSTTLFRARIIVLTNATHLTGTMIYFCSSVMTIVARVRATLCRFRCGMVGTRNAYPSARLRIPSIRMESVSRSAILIFTRAPSARSALRVVPVFWQLCMRSASRATGVSLAAQRHRSHHL